MELGPKELMSKFPCLEKFSTQKWLCEESVKMECNYKELPLQAAFALIKDTIAFIERTKFNSRWEEGFSVKVRLQQIESLLSFFCQDTEEEKTIKGANL